MISWLWTTRKSNQRQTQILTLKRKSEQKISIVKYDWQEIYNLMIKFKKEVIEHHRKHDKWSNVARLLFHEIDVVKSTNLIVIFDMKIKIYFYQMFDAFVMLEMKMILNERWNANDMSLEKTNTTSRSRDRMTRANVKHKQLNHWLWSHSIVNWREIENRSNEFAKTRIEQNIYSTKHLKTFKRRMRSVSREKNERLNVRVWMSIQSHDFNFVRKSIWFSHRWRWYRNDVSRSRNIWISMMSTSNEEFDTHTMTKHCF